MPRTPASRRTPRRPTVPNAGRRIARKAAERSHPAPGNGQGGAMGDGASPRFREVHATLDRELRQRFPHAEAVEAYGMPGWRIARPRRVEWTHGTIDPNLVQVFLAERAQGGLSLHLWNPYDPAALAKRRDELAEAGFKVMVGCLQYQRRSGYPVGAVLPLLDDIATEMESEGGAVDGDGPRQGKAAAPAKRKAPGPAKGAGKAKGASGKAAGTGKRASVGKAAGKRRSKR